MPDAKKEFSKVMMTLYIIIALVAVGAIMAVVGGMGLDMDNMDYHLGLLIGGIMLAFLSAVFGIPLVWLRNTERRKSLRIAVLILSSDRSSISVLAGSVGCSDADARNKVIWALNNGYLPGYVISGDEVMLAKLLDPNQQEHAVECPNCGASFTYIGKIGQCPYCGDYYPPQNKH